MCDATGLPQRTASRLRGLSLSACSYDALHPAADAHLSGRWSAGVLVTAAYGSYCAVKGFWLITSACTAYII